MAIPSLFGILQKAQPRWSTADVCKVQEKLHKVNVTDVESLGQAIMEGSLNTQLGALGERKLKASTLAQLKIQVRTPFRAARLAQETISTNATRSCFCGKCLLSGSSRAPTCDLTVISALVFNSPQRKSSKSASATGALETKGGPSAQRGHSGKALQQVGSYVIAKDDKSKSLRKAESDSSLTRKVRIDDASLSEAAGGSSGSRPSLVMSLLGSAAKPIRTRSGALDLPEVPGGMRSDDDSLQQLLRSAEAQLKRGYIRCQPKKAVHQASPSSFEQPPNVMDQSSFQRQQDPQVEEPNYDASKIYTAMSRDIEELPMQDGFRSPTPESFSVDSVRTIERVSGYTTSNTAMSMHKQGLDKSSTPEMIPWASAEDVRQLDRGMLDCLGSRGTAGQHSRADSAHTYSTYSTQEYPEESQEYADEFSGDGSTGEGSESQRSREASQIDAYSTPMWSLRLTDQGSVASARSKELQQLEDPSGRSRRTDQPVGSRPRVRLPRRAASYSQIDGSGSLASRRQQGTLDRVEAARESRRRRWVNAYDDGGAALASRASLASSILSSYSGYTGYSVPTSSAYTAMSGMSLERPSRNKGLHEP
jgi:hypothetical protein